MHSLPALLLQYKYAILFPLAIFEGPIVTIIAGFMVISGTLNVFLAYPIVVAGDVAGDALAYIMGKWGSGFIARHGSKVGLTPAKLDEARTYFHEHRKKALFFSKVFHGVGFAGLVVAGNLKIPYRKFFLTCFIISLVQSAIFMVLGVLFGQAYTLIATYLNYYAAAAIVIVVIVAIIFFLRKFKLK